MISEKQIPSPSLSQADQDFAKTAPITSPCPLQRKFKRRECLSVLPDANEPSHRQKNEHF